MKYFLSYTSRDKEITSEILCEYSLFLKEYGDVYIDLLHNDSVNKQERVFQELDRCDIFLILETKNVYKSEWVLMEIERAKKLKKRIIKIPLYTFNENKKLSLPTSATLTINT